MDFETLGKLIACEDIELRLETCEDYGGYYVHELQIVRKCEFFTKVFEEFMTRKGRVIPKRVRTYMGPEYMHTIILGSH